jgi:hypothetical protein
VPARKAERFRKYILVFILTSINFMPYSFPKFGDQPGNWFTVLIVIGLPFYIFFRLAKNDLPYLRDVGPRIL